MTHRSFTFLSHSGGSDDNLAAAINKHLSDNTAQGWTLEHTTATVVYDPSTYDERYRHCFFWIKDD